MAIRHLTKEELKAKVQELQLVLLNCEKIETECVSEDGLCDSIDNHGDLYQSQHLAMLIEEAEREIGEHNG